MNPTIENLIILGTGPAGLTAAIYAARADLKPLVISGDVPGGQLTTTTLVENYPGFVDGIMGPKLMMDMRAQAERFGTRFVNGWATSIDLSSAPYKLTVDGKEYQSKALIISTGSKPKTLGIPSEQTYWAKGVSTCATCDGAFFRNKTIMVVGGGDSAMEEATFLTRFATHVYVAVRTDTLRASKIMQERAYANEKITFLWNTQIAEVLGNGEHVTGITIKDTRTSEESEMPLDGVFLAIGHVPNTSLFEGVLELDEMGYLKTLGGAKTSIPGIFACGDVQDHVYRQAITAAGSGCMAAIDCERYLQHG